MECKDIVFSGHAVGRMFERGINEIDLSEIIAEGELIDEYPDDKRFPSVLLLGRVNHQAIHVVLGVDPATGVCYVITVYLPDPGLWLTGFQKRRSPLDAFYAGRVRPVRDRLRSRSNGATRS